MLTRWVCFAFRHAQRQFSRLVEMLQLLHTDEADPRAWRAYRLQVKERLYRFNFVSCPFLCALRYRPHG